MVKIYYNTIDNRESTAFYLTLKKINFLTHEKISINESKVVAIFFLNNVKKVYNFLKHKTITVWNLFNDIKQNRPTENYSIHCSKRFLTSFFRNQTVK